MTITTVLHYAMHALLRFCIILTGCCNLFLSCFVLSPPHDLTRQSPQLAPDVAEDVADAEAAIPAPIPLVQTMGGMTRPLMQKPPLGVVPVCTTFSPCFCLRLNSPCVRITPSVGYDPVKLGTGGFMFFVFVFNLVFKEAVLDFVAVFCSSTARLLVAVAVKPDNEANMDNASLILWLGTSSLSSVLVDDVLLNSTSFCLLACKAL